MLDYEVECKECDDKSDEGDNETNLIMYANVNDEFEPNNYQEAINCSDRDLRKDSMKEQLDAHDKMKIWQVIKRNKMPTKASIVTSKWVYRVKSKLNGQKEKQNGIARGFADLNYMTMELMKHMH